MCEDVCVVLKFLISKLLSPSGINFCWQTIDIKLTQVIAGGAVLGSDNVVRIGILPNDSPTGIFSFVSLQVN